MNRYEESLARIKKSLELNKGVIDVDLAPIEELVSKTIAKEPKSKYLGLYCVMTCQHCGKHIQFFGNYCTQCGGKLYERNEQ